MQMPTPRAHKYHLAVTPTLRSEDLSASYVESVEVPYSSGSWYSHIGLLRSGVLNSNDRKPLQCHGRCHKRGVSKAGSSVASKAVTHTPHPLLNGTLEWFTLSIPLRWLDFGCTRFPKRLSILLCRFICALTYGSDGFRDSMCLVAACIFSSCSCFHGWRRGLFSASPPSTGLGGIE
jgi:hypothetical protein